MHMINDGIVAKHLFLADQSLALGMFCVALFPGFMCMSFVLQNLHRRHASCGKIRPSARISFPGLARSTLAARNSLKLMYHMMK